MSTSSGRPASGRPGRRQRVVVVAQGAPARGGIATFAETVVGDPVLGASFDLGLINTTRRAVRVGGKVSAANAWHALVDASRVFRAARRADVVHVQTALLPTPPLLRALALCGAARLGGAGVLCHAHTGLANEGPTERFRPTRMQRFLLRRLRFVDAMLTVSEAGSAGLRAHMGPETRIERVDNGIRVEDFAGPDAGSEPPTILFVGTLARRKGLLDLAEALRILQADGVMGYELVVVGSGSEAGKAEEAAVRSAFGEIGRDQGLAGPLHGEALRERLHSASLFVLPSHSEGQPIGIMEAMASGLPVVATRIGAIPDLVRDGVDGVLVDPGRPDQLATALRALLTDPERRRSMGAAARARARERFGLDALRPRLSALYAEAASRRIRRGGG